MIPSDSPYWNQVRLLVEILPFVAEEDCFALKGGTVKWKLHNLARMEKGAHQRAVERLARLLDKI